MTTVERDPRHRVRDGIYAIARLWVQKLHGHVAHEKKEYYHYFRLNVNGDAQRFSASVCQVMGELEAGSSTISRWMLVKALCDTDSKACHQQLLYLIEHQRLLDETRRDSLRLQLQASLLSIEESRKGIEQSKQVGRLTQLAFVFIPLTFVTGVFGMNITPFGGTAPLWKFWVTAGTISGIAFIIGLMTVWSDLWARLRRWTLIRSMLWRLP